MTIDMRPFQYSRRGEHGSGPHCHLEFQAKRHFQARRLPGPDYRRFIYATPRHAMPHHATPPRHAKQQQPRDATRCHHRHHIIPRHRHHTYQLPSLAGSGTMTSCRCFNSGAATIAHALFHCTNTHSPPIGTPPT